MGSMTSAMNELEANTRMLLALVTYLKRHPGILLTELAEHFGVSPEDMRHVLMEELLLSGLPPYTPSDYFMIFIDASPKGERVRLHMAEEFRHPLKLTLPEALVTKSMLQSYSRSLDPELQPVADSLVDKLVEAMGLPADVADQPSHLALAKHSVVLKEHLALLDQAIRDDRVIAMEYYSASRGSLEKREIEPLLLFEEASRFYVRGWCHLRRAERSFRVDRIRQLKLLTRETGRPVGVGSGDERPRAVPGWDGAGKRGTMLVRFEPNLADEVESEWRPRGAKVSHEKDGSLLLELPLYSEAWAVGWVMGFGCQAELLEPAHLREDLIQRLRLMRKQIKRR